jgi:hypothetical protein
MADVTVMHSVTTRAIGSTAMEMAMRALRVRATAAGVIVVVVVVIGVVGIRVVGVGVVRSVLGALAAPDGAALLLEVVVLLFAMVLRLARERGACWLSREVKGIVLWIRDAAER